MLINPYHKVFHCWNTKV